MRRHTGLLAVVAVVFAVALVGCGDQTTSGDPSASPPNGSWTVTSITVDGRPASLAAPASVEFLRDRLSISTGCNTMAGEFSIADDKLVATDLSQTEMGCEPKLMDQESRFATLFGAAVSVDWNGAEMTLTGSGVVVEMTKG